MIITPAYAQAFPAIAQATAGLTQMSGVLTNNSITVTGLASTALLSAGMPIFGPNIQDGTQILTIISSTSITMTQAATASGTFLLTVSTSALLTQLIKAAQSAMESYVDFPFEVLKAQEYYSGANCPDIVLRRPYVSNVAAVVLDCVSGGSWGQYQLSQQIGCVVTLNSAVVTGLNTSGLVAGQQVLDGFPPTGLIIPLPCWIASIDSPTQITLTSAALANGTAVTFTGCFGQSLLLPQGRAWALTYEGNYKGLSNSARIRFCPMNPGGWWSSGASFLGGQGWGAQGSGSLTLGGQQRYGWPMGQGNVMVVYTAGWVGKDGGPSGTATPTIPDDLCQACCELVQYLAIITPFGGASLTNESLGKYSYGLGNVMLADVAKNALAAAGNLGTVRQILSRYRDIAL